MKKTNGSQAQKTQVAPTLRVATYRRVSTPRQVRIYGDFGSLEKQDAAIDHYLAGESRKTWVLRHKVQDKAELGDDPSRPGIHAILEAARRREFDVLIVCSQDRLARGKETLKPIVDELEACGVEIYDTMGRRISFSEHEHAIATTVMAMTSDIEQTLIRGRRSNDTALTATNGVWSGSVAPIGYTAFKIDRTRTLKIDPATKERALELFRRIAALESVGSILEDFKKRGILTPSRKSRAGVERGRRLFNWDHIFTIIGNPIYKGCLRLSCRIYNRYKKRLPTPIEILSNGDAVYKGKHEALVSPELWAKANAALKDRQKLQRKPRTADSEGRFLLQGIIHCGECGRLMTTVKKGHGHYVCMNVARPDRIAQCQCRVRQISAPIAEDAVIRMLCEVAKHPDFTDAMLEFSKPSPATGRKLRALRAESSKLAQQCENVINAISTASSHEARTILTARLDQLKLQQMQARRQLEVATGFKHASFATPASIQATIDSLQSAIGRSDRPMLKTLLRTLFSSVIVDRVGRNGEGRFRVKLILNYPALAGNGGTPTQLDMEIEVPPSGRNYQIRLPFEETREPLHTSRTAPEKFPLAMLERFSTLAETHSGTRIAAECGKTRAHVSQILSLRRIDPRLRSRILSAEPRIRQRFSLRKLLAIAKLAPSLQTQEVEVLLNSGQSKVA